MNDHLPPASTCGDAVTQSEPQGPTDITCAVQAPIAAHIRALARDGSQAERFERLLKRRFVPGARIRAVLASGPPLFMLDAFVQPIGDSLIGPDDMGRLGIIDALAQTAAILRHRGAVGIDFSPLRRKGSPVAGTAGCRAAGPAAYLQLFEQLHYTVRGPNVVRGSVTASLRIEHPDIQKFLASTSSSGVRRCVALSDVFMRALRDDADVELGLAPVPRVDSGGAGAGAGPGGARCAQPMEVRRVTARELFQRILSPASNSPLGLAFIDAGYARAALSQGEQSASPVLRTGPSLPPYGAIAHGALMLPAFLRGGAAGPHFDWDAFGATVAGAVEFLDRVIELTECPLPQHQVELHNKRPIALRCGRLSETLGALGLRQCSEDGIAFTHRVWSALRDRAVMASVGLARAEGPYPLFDAERYLRTGSFGATLPAPLQTAIRRHGMRNSRLLSAWLADDRGRDGMNIDERMLALATVAPLVDGDAALPLKIPRDCAIEDVAGIAVKAWTAGAQAILLHDDRGGSRKPV